MEIFCDGGARGNPGPSAAAFVVFKNDKAVYQESRYLGVNTNNYAEYTSLLMALEWINKNANSDVKIILDSELVKKQMTGEYKIKNNTLRLLAVKAKHLENKFRYSITYENVLREKNKHADNLVNQTLDLYSANS